MTEKGYQGWKNYETWCVNLWLNNEESSYHEFRRLAKNFMHDTEFRERETYDLAKAIKDLVEERAEDVLAAQQMKGDPYSGMIADIFHANLSLVDWEEIAKGFMEE